LYSHFYGIKERHCCRATVFFTLLMVFLLLLCGGCNKENQSANSKEDDDSASQDDDSSGLELAITYHRIPSEAAPPNPISLRAGPDKYNKAAFTRYRMTANGESLPVRYVLIAEGGFMGGANNFNYMAKELVKRSKGSLEVWAVDRRPNLLEDLTGVEAAEREHNPDLVYEYYLEGKTVDERTFDGFFPDRNLDYLSEWGMTTAVNDLAAMIDLIPAEYQRTHVFLAGHSLGGLLIENFAAWDFDGDPATSDDAGFNRVAGLALIDGSITDFSEITWLWKLVDFITGISNDNYEFALWFIRNFGPRYFALPIMQRIMVDMEAWAMAADWDPDGISNAYDRVKDLSVALKLMYAGTGRITVSNAALLGLVLDNDFQWISAMDSSFGELIGPTRTRKAPIPVFYADKTKEYLLPEGEGPFGWKGSADLNPLQPDEVTDLHTIANAVYEGRTNWIEWYFTTRIVLDIIFNNDLDIEPNPYDARWREGLRSIHVALCDMPVIGFGAANGFLYSERLFDKYRNMLPSVRDSGGAPRTEAGYEVHILPGYSHHDPMLAGTKSRPNLMFPSLLNWMDKWAGQETFIIPEIESYP